MLFAGWSLRFDGARRMYSCDSCRRLLNQGCACAGNGRSTRHDYIFFCACLSEFWRVYSSESLLGGVPYLLSDKPTKIDGKRLELQFELRTPATLKIPEQPDGYSIRVSLYIETRESGFAFIDWNSITRNPEHVIIPGKVPLLRTARLARCSPRSVTGRPRRNSLS